jgi:hypothetical protein
MLHAHFVHELESGHVLARQRFEKGAAQVLHPFGVALGGVDALFLRRQSSACKPCQTVVRPTAGPPLAASSTRNSSSVASGCRATQAANWMRAAASSKGDGPPRWGKAASVPLVRWRLSNLLTKDRDTLNRAATCLRVLSPAAQEAAIRSRKSAEYGFITQRNSFLYTLTPNLL